MGILSIVLGFFIHRTLLLTVIFLNHSRYLTKGCMEKIEENKMKSRALKCLILASTLALFNCDDSVNNAIDQANAGAQDIQTDPNAGVDPNTGIDPNGGIDPNTQTDPNAGIGGQGGEGVQIIGESGATVTPGGETILSSSAVVPESSGDVLVTSSANALDPASSSAVAPATSSSSVAAQQSSSSEQVASSSSEEVKPAGIFLAEGTDENKDQMQIVYTENIEPAYWDKDKNRNLYKILAYPKQLSSDKKHAVVVWGPGGGSDPKEYSSIIKRLASHGFVVVALPVSPGDASQGTAALDWLEQKNSDPNDPLYQKLDMTKVGASGHSMGGLESEQLVIKDKRVLTAFLNNSGDWNGAGANKVATDRSIAILYGEGGMERGNAENDYNNAGVKAPACLIQMTGGRGNECYEVSPGRKECGYGHGSGSWDGMAATVAWMRWHLGGEDFRKADFVGTSGKYIDGNIAGHDGKWKGQCKNFN